MGSLQKCILASRLLKSGIFYCNYMSQLVSVLNFNKALELTNEIYMMLLLDFIAKRGEYKDHTNIALVNVMIFLKKHESCCKVYYRYKK